MRSRASCKVAYLSVLLLALNIKVSNSKVSFFKLSPNVYLYSLAKPLVN